MTTFEATATNGTAPTGTAPTGAGPVTSPSRPQAALSSPFALTELSGAGSSPAPSPSTMASPFLEGLLSETGITAENEMTDLLLTELEDDGFAEALEALANEGAARSLRSPLLWSEAAGTALLDTTAAEQWMETVASRAVDMIGELETHFGDRTVESVAADEVDRILGPALHQLTPGSLHPLDAQELFFGKLVDKVKKVVKGATTLVKKGIQAASKLLPINAILKRLKGLIKPLLHRVLGKAIGKLPQSLQQPARRLAERYGLHKGGSDSEYETDYDYLAAEFDSELVEALLSGDNEFAALEAELQRESAADAAEPNTAVQLDAARHRLGQALEQAEPNTAPIEAMEQFIPAVLLPIAKMGIKVAGRKRVIGFVAQILAKLIAPIVGKQLSAPLAAQIADKGFGLLGLEAEAGRERLGSEAVVAAAEEALDEVFGLPEQWLENELLLEMAVQDAFHAAALRHFPARALRSDLAAGRTDDDSGVWLMMPRSSGPAYRFKQYSRTLPVVITPDMARSVVFRGGETLEERLYEEGVDSWPVNAEVEYYELLPGGTVGHLTAADRSGAPDGDVAAALEFDVIDDPGALPVPEGEHRRRHKPRAGSSPDRGRGKRVVRIKARGRALRRRSPVAVRLDLSGGQPTVQLHLAVGERRAAELAERLGRQEHREVLAALTKLAEGPVREVVAGRLSAIFKRRQIKADEGAGKALSNRLFDGLVAALGSQINELGSSLAAAAKDPAPGLTITAAFRFPTKEALTSGEPEAPTLTVRPGRHRD